MTQKDGFYLSGSKFDIWRCIQLGLIVIVLLSFEFTALHAQNGMNASGGNATGSGGIVTYSVGQVVYSTDSGANGSVAQGVQQSHENSSLIDMQIDKTVNNPTPDVNDNVVFTVTATNNNSSVTATNISVTDNITSDFSYQSHSSTVGSTYTPATDTWSIPSLGPGASVTLDITVTVLASGDNTASLDSFDQTDPVTTNNSDYAAVTVSGSSGGGSGGIESDGSIAEKMALRNFTRLKTDKIRVFDNKSELIQFRELDVKSGLLVPASNLKTGTTNLLDYIPEQGPSGTQAHIVTPEDLLYLSNAVEVFSVDYFREDNRRMATIMAMTTPDGQVYNHTKMVCDRLNGANLKKIDIVKIKNHSFIRGMLIQDNGEIDYAISFVAYESGGLYVIDNQWLNSGYHIPAKSDVFNFQVWSANPIESNKLVEEILERMEADKDLLILNEDEQRIPKVYVTNGYYKDGNLFLEIQNFVNAKEITVSGSLTRIENGEREDFRITKSLNQGQSIFELVEIPLGYVFDAGFSVANDCDRQKDQLYFADGPWGKYTQGNGGIVEEFEIYPHTGSADPNAFTLERSVSISGEVKTYVTLFKSLIVGNKPVDLSSYNQLEFEASGHAMLEIVVALDSINSWSFQPRKIIQLEPEKTTFIIDYADLQFPDKAQQFTGGDVVSVVFNVLGNNSTYDDFEMHISNLKFKNGTVDSEISGFYGISAYNYPNPFSDQTTILFDLPLAGNVKIVLCDILGVEILVISESYFNAGENKIIFNTGNQASGNYLYKIFTDEFIVMEKITILK